MYIIFNYPKIKKILLSVLIVIYYVMSNFFYTELASFLFLRKIFITFTTILKHFSFFLQLNFDIFLGPFFAFCFSLLQINFDIFACFFLESFFVFLIIIICHFYVQKKKIIKNILLVLFICFKN